MDHTPFLVTPGTKIRLKDFDPADTGTYRSERAAERTLTRDLHTLRHLQNVLFAQHRYGLLVILQGMDAAGKDGIIRHVISGGNPNWFTTKSFKAPSREELRHDFLWRCWHALPERGTIAFFNRSHYEETVVVRVHPELLTFQSLPPETTGPKLWKERYRSINDMERHLTNNGFLVLKFFLHISKAEQKKRFTKRIAKREKNWKFSLEDIKKRAQWKTYMRVYEDVFEHTSTEYAPWQIVPADHKWFARALITNAIVEQLKALNLEYPTINRENRNDFLEAKVLLKSEKGK